MASAFLALPAKREDLQEPESRAGRAPARAPDVRHPHHGSHAARILATLATSACISLGIGSPDIEVQDSHGKHPLNDIACTSATTCIAVGQVRDQNKARVLRTTDGKTWSEQSVPFGSLPLFAVDFPDAATGYAAGGGERAGGTLLKTTDGGASWIPLSANSSLPLHGIRCPTTSRCYAVGGFSAVDIVLQEKGVILTTTDGGAHWSVQDAPEDTELWDVDCIDEKTCLAIGRGTVLAEGTGPGQRAAAGQVFRTNDGVSWSKVSTCPAGGVRVRMIDASTAYVASGNSGVGKTTSGGALWKDLPVQDFVGSIDCATPLVCVGVGFSALEDLMVRTTDGGETWSEIETGSWDILNGVEFADGSTFYAVGNATADNAAILKSKPACCTTAREVDRADAPESGTMRATFQEGEASNVWDRPFEAEAIGGDIDEDGQLSLRAWRNITPAAFWREFNIRLSDGPTAGKTWPVHEVATTQGDWSRVKFRELDKKWIGTGGSITVTETAGKKVSLSGTVTFGPDDSDFLAEQEPGAHLGVGTFTVTIEATVNEVSGM